MKKIWFVVGVVVLLLGLILAVTLSVEASGPPPGCNGDIKTHDGNGEPSPIDKDEPKVCTFHLHGFNFDPGGVVHWRIETHPGGSEVASGSLTMDSNGQGRTGLVTDDDGNPLPNGQYKVYWHEEGCPGGDKHKVFKVECPPPPPPPPPAECNEDCTKVECVEGLECIGGVCRNPDCPEEEDCICPPPPPPPAECNEPCDEVGCIEGLECIGDVCRNPDCPEEEDCICPLPPLAECNDICEVDGDCTDDLECIGGVCRNPDCPEEEDCICPLPCPNALLIKVVTRCGVGVSGVNIHLKSNRGDRIPSPDKMPMLTDSTGTVVFTRDMGITPRDNKEWRIYLDGVLHDTFKVTECEQTITIYNELPCPSPTPTPPPELPEELPVTGVGPPQSGVNPFALVGLVVAAIGICLRSLPEKETLG